MRPAVLAGLLLVAGCVWSSSPAPTPSAPPPASPSTEQVAWPVPALPDRAGLHTVEHWVGGAKEGDDVPVVVLVHGLGDDPNRFSWVMADFDEPARVVLPAGPTSFGEGFAWMTVRLRDGDPDGLARQLDASAARVAALCRDLTRGGRKPVIAGFSQGGMVSWAVATRHPDTVAAAIPIAGFLPPVLLPAPGSSPAPIHALHGTADPIVPLSYAKAGRDALAAAGHETELEVFSGVEHRVPRPVRSALYRELRAAFER